MVLILGGVVAGSEVACQIASWGVRRIVVEHYLRGIASSYEKVLSAAERAIRAKVEVVAERLATRALLLAGWVTEILKRVGGFQTRVGYRGDYRAWIAGGRSSAA